MLRASAQATGVTIDLRAVGGGEYYPGRQDAAALLRFTDALVGRTDELQDARSALIEVLGPDSVAAVASDAWVLLLECKSLRGSPQLDAGEYNAVRNAETTVAQGAKKMTKDLQEILALDIPLTGAISGRRVYWAVVTPRITYVQKPWLWRETNDLGLRRVMSQHELTVALSRLSEASMPDHLP